jgi:uncharacterized damage-inducible protein DinB
MAQQTMTEKDVFLQTWDQEFQTTVKVLKAYPADKLDYKPHPKSRSARELAWNFVIEEHIVDATLKGNIDFTAPMPPAPKTMAEIISAYEKTHRDMVQKVKATSEEDLSKTIKFPVAPKQMGDLKRSQVLWTMVMDTVHHRGQLSVYIRLAGGKVPSIYGPSADEPWM